MLVLIHEERGIGKIVLNRQERLNALTMEMLEIIESALLRWKDDSAIVMVTIESANPKAFCAGADVRIFYENGIERADLSIAFCHKEYAINRILYHYPKPYIAIVNGLDMGGGVGLSLHGSHLIATENFTFAMPEVLISFFPDAGSTYVLSRLPYHVGFYLALTGSSIHAGDAKRVGLIKHIIDSAKIEHFKALLPDINRAIQECEIEGPEPILDLEEIDRSFREPMLGTFWTLVQEAKTMSFDEVSRRDEELAALFLRQPEIYEAIYRRLIKRERAGP